MTQAFRFIGAILMFFIASEAFAQADENAWDQSHEVALRALIAKENVIIESYLTDGEIKFPCRRLRVPPGFIELYQVSPVDCLVTLADIVEKGAPHDAIVAFQFGLAGDQPQIALPLFHYLGPKMLDQPFGSEETYRQCCVRIIRKELAQKK